MLETEIEVFRAGRSSRGIGPDQLAEVAAFDCEANPLAVCFGHPENDTPAAGTISKLRADGNSLFATVKSLTKKAIDGIKGDEWLNRSFAFFHPTHEANPTPGKWAPRHLGLLGAAAPGIPGMPSLKKSLSFTAETGLVADGDPADAIVYSGEATTVHFIATEKEKPVADEFTAEQLAENQRLKDDREQLERDRTAFAASQKTQFEASNTALISGLVATGKVLPAEVKDLSTVFNALSSDELTFDADRKGTAAATLATFLATALDKRVPLGKRESPSGQFNAAEGLTPAAIKAKADKLVETEGLTFDAAVERVHTEIEAAQA